MSNNIYDIMKKLNAVEGIDKVPETQSKNTTLLEATMQEVLGEKYMGFKAVAASAKKGGAKDPEAVAASIGRKKYGKEKFQAAAAKGKKLSERTWTNPETGEIHGSLASRLEPNPPQSSAPSLQQQMADQAARRRQSMQQPAAQPNYSNTVPRDSSGNPTQSYIKQPSGGFPGLNPQSQYYPKTDTNVMNNALKQSSMSKLANMAAQDAQMRAKELSVKEDDMEEGNLFTGNLAKARAAGKKRADLDGDGDMETVKEQGVAEGSDSLRGTNEPKKKDAWGEGYWVGHRREDRDCPYPPGSFDAEMWELGYHEGNKDRKNEMTGRVMEEKKTTKTGIVHKAKPGRYGGYDPETDPDKDEDDKKSEPAVKRGRGRPKKSADSETGEVKKWDTSALQSAFGSSAPKKLPGKASVKHKMNDDDKLDEVAPPGKKAERMVKNIKKGYAKDGKLTDKEKGIAYATTWKAHNKGKVEESIPPGFPKSLAKKIYEQCDGDMKNTLSTMWKVYNSVMESKKSSKKKISEGMKFEQSTTKPAMGTYKGGLWTADPPKKGEVGAPVPSPDEGAPVKQQSKRRPQKEDVSENKELNDVLKLAGMVDESVKVDECGMSPISGAYGDTMHDTEGRMSINTNMSTDGNKTVTITADGDSAVELMKMLKMAGLSADSGEDTDIEKMSEEKDDRYEANTTPEEEVLPVQTQLKGGDGEVAGKEKKMTPHGYKFADNPMAMSESMTLKLMKEYESIKKVK